MSLINLPFEIAGISVKNRIARSATVDCMAEADGGVSPGQLMLYKKLADGGAGLITAGAAYVDENGQLAPKQLSASSDSDIEGLRRLGAVIKSSGAFSVIQLFHGGIHSRYAMHKKRPPLSVESDGNVIKKCAVRFGAAALRARTAGFDGIQIHGAHDYLFSQFLSPIHNRRTDKYGGSPEKRMRLHLDVLAEVRKSAGDDFPVLFKIGLADMKPGGLTLEDGLPAASALAENGCDGFEVSQGLRGRDYSGTEYRTGIDGPPKEAYFRNFSRRLKDVTDVPVILAGGIRSRRVIDEILSEGSADAVSLCRPFINSPGIADILIKNPGGRSCCNSCNECINTLFEQRRLCCCLEN